jgi:hypothetical protein
MPLSGDSRSVSRKFWLRPAGGACELYYRELRIFCLVPIVHQLRSGSIRAILEQHVTQ